MKKYSNDQIKEFIRRVDDGMPVVQLCSEIGVAPPTFYVWRRKLTEKKDKQQAQAPCRCKILTQENELLKRLVANQALDLEIYKEKVKR